MDVQLDFIRSLPYFSGLEKDELAAVGKYFFNRTAERGEIILFEDEPAEALYFVVSGVVKVYKTSAEGKEQILCLARPGESFNDMPVFGNGRNVANVEALGPVDLFGVKREDFLIILRDYPLVGMNVIKVLSQRIEHLVSLVEDLSFRPVIGRVAKVLLEHAVDEAGRHPRLTQQEMAAIAGTAREVVGRALKTMEEKGIIGFDSHRLLVRDRKALAALAGVTD